MSHPDPERIAVIIPALDEEESLPLVLMDLREAGLLGSAVVVDNGSRDGTAEAARAAGATVVSEPRRGYGAACLRGLAAVDRLRPGAEFIVFLDADRSDDAAELPSLLAPLARGTHDLVVGSRALGPVESGSILPHQRLGTAMYCALIGVLFGHRYSDLGPFRAIRGEALRRLGMRDRGYGWTVEMQIRALLAGLRVTEIPVSHRRRVGRSKISGTVRGSVLAALKMAWTIVRLRLAAGAGRRGTAG